MKTRNLTRKPPFIANLHLPIRTIPGTQSLPEKSLRAAKSKTPGRVLPPFGICISTLRQREQAAAATLPRLYYSLRPKLFIHPFVPLSRSRAALSGTMGPVLFTFITRRCRRPSAMQSFSRYTLFFPSCMCAYIYLYIYVYMSLSSLKSAIGRRRSNNESRRSEAEAANFIILNWLVTISEHMVHRCYMLHMHQQFTPRANTHTHRHSAIAFKMFKMARCCSE